MLRRFFDYFFFEPFKAIEEANSETRTKHTIRPHEETEWGTMFTIVDPSGKVVGYDRKKAAQERCAALNASLANTVKSDLASRNVVSRHRQSD